MVARYHELRNPHRGMVDDTKACGTAGGYVVVHMRGMTAPKQVDFVTRNEA